MFAPVTLAPENAKLNMRLRYAGPQFSTWLFTPPNHLNCYTRPAIYFQWIFATSVNIYMYI